MNQTSQDQEKLNSISLPARDGDGKSVQQDGENTRVDIPEKSQDTVGVLVAERQESIGPVDALPKAESTLSKPSQDPEKATEPNTGAKDTSRTIEKSRTTIDKQITVLQILLQSAISAKNTGLDIRISYKQESDKNPPITKYLLYGVKTCMKCQWPYIGEHCKNPECEDYVNKGD